MRYAPLLCVLAACGGGQPAPPPPPAATPAAAPAPAAPRVLRAARVNGTTLAYRLVGDSAGVEGQRTPVVFVHGSLADFSDWDGQVPSFARIYRVLAYSRRYHRPNPPQEDGQVYSPALHAEDLAALLLQLDLAPAHVVGSSYGAYTALALALEHPQLVRSLVLAEPPVFSLLTGLQAGDSIRRAFFAAALDPARAAFVRGDSVAAVRAFLDAASGTPGRFDNLAAPVRAAVLAHSFELRREMLANREEYLPRVACADLGRVHTPVLLLKGDRSPRMFQIITDELARCLRSDTTVTIPGAGYRLHGGNPVAYAQTLLGYFATH